MAYEVTIGIPVYNAAKFIRRAIDSALAQTFSCIEFLIHDDCGTDSSIDIVREYQKTHPRGKDIRIVSQPQNMGIGEARNRILDEAQGKYLYFMDADDTIAPNALELLYNASQKYDAEIVYGSYKRIEEYSEKTNHIYHKYDPMVFLRENEFALWVYKDYNNLQAMIWNILIKTDLYRRNNLHFLHISYLEDLAFTMDLPAYLTRTVMLNDITYYYYCREGSASRYEKRTRIEKREIEDIISVLNFFKDNSVLWKDKTFFPQRMRKVLVTCYFVATHIVKNEAVISPPFTKKEIRDVLHLPAFYLEMFKPGRCMLRNITLYLLGALPPSLSVWLMKIKAR